MFCCCVEEAVAVFSDSTSSIKQRLAALQQLAAAFDLAAPEIAEQKVLAVLRQAGSDDNQAVRSAAAAVALCVLQHGPIAVIGTADGYWLPGLLLQEVELAAPQHVLLAAVQHAIAACEQQQHSVSICVTLRAMSALVQQSELPVAAAWPAAHCAAVLLFKHSSDSAVHCAAHAVITALGRRSDFWHSLGNSASGVQSLVAIDTLNSSSSSSSSSKIQELPSAGAAADHTTSCDSESAGLQALLDFIQQCGAVSSSNRYATDAVLAEWTSTSAALTALQVNAFYQQGSGYISLIATVTCLLYCCGQALLHQLCSVVLVKFASSFQGVRLYLLTQSCSSAIQRSVLTYRYCIVCTYAGLCSHRQQ
jgi:hypothetical protein